MASPKIRHLRYEALRRRLSEVEEWPYQYFHKIIGENRQEFLDSVENLENKFPKMKKKDCSVSRKGNYLSMTYEIMAEDVDEIISLWLASEKVENYIKIL